LIKKHVEKKKKNKAASKAIDTNIEKRRKKRVG
jgi:hypothetical protein